ncbi:MAG: hypothetical protein ACRDZR_14845, partial [Acidimicrobiales bacterium]
MYEFRPLSAGDAHAVLGWHYPEPYSFYDLTADQDDLEEFLDVTGWKLDSHFGAWDANGTLAGFITLERTEPEVIKIGLAMRPDLTGKGKGESYLFSEVHHLPRTRAYRWEFRRAAPPLAKNPAPTR